MDLDWELLERAKEEKVRIEKEIKDEFFGSSEKPNYFYEIKADVEVTSLDVIVKTLYNSYRFKRKKSGKFVFKKDKLSQYFYAIDASYTLETWEKGLEAAKKDFEEVLAISDELIKFLEKNSKKTIASSMKNFYNSFFSKKEKQASIEYKEDLPKEEEEAKKEDKKEDLEDKKES